MLNKLDVTQLSLLTLAIFGLLVFVIYWIVPKKCRWIPLLVFSYALAYILSSYWIFLLVVTTTVVYVCALLIGRQNKLFSIKKEGLEKDEKKRLKKKYARIQFLYLWIGIVVNLLIWALLKYCNLPIFKLNNFFEKHSLVYIAFPILGISYYTLQALGYLIDVYRGKYDADKNYFRVALFLAYFPQLIEGPIGRYNDLACQLFEGKNFEYKRTAHGIQLFLWGLFKKIVIADRIDIVAREVFANYSQYSGGIIALTAVFYAFQLYADFSGYIDMATGISQMYGFDLAKNFDRPFFSQTVGEFWRRWHISLGGWLRDYIFYPVSFSKPFMAVNKKMHGKIKPFFEKFVASAIPLFFVWLSCGVWHGSGPQYVVYGMYYYLIMMIGMLLEPVYAKILNKMHINKDAAIMKAIRIARTFVIVCIGLMLFRSASIADFGKMFAQLFRSGQWKIVSSGVINLYDFVMIFATIAILLGVEIWQSKVGSVREQIDKANIVVRYTVWLVLILSIIIFGAYGVTYQAVAPMYALY